MKTTYHINLGVHSKMLDLGFRLFVYEDSTGRFDQIEVASCSGLENVMLSSNYPA